MADTKAAFKQRLQQEFAKMQEGQTFTFRRTFTDGDVAIFCGVTGDYNPYHIDETFARENWFGRRIVPGLLTGSMITNIGGLLGILATEMHFQYLKPVYIGDTITCVVTVVKKDVEKRTLVMHATFTNQDGLEVLSAQFNGFPANIRLAQ